MYVSIYIYIYIHIYIYKKSQTNARYLKPSHVEIDRETINICFDLGLGMLLLNT